MWLFPLSKIGNNGIFNKISFFKIYLAVSSKILGFPTKKFIKKEYENEFESDRIKFLRQEKEENQFQMEFIRSKIEQINQKNKRCASGNLSDYVYVRPRTVTTFSATRRPCKISNSIFL